MSKKILIRKEVTTFQSVGGGAKPTIRDLGRAAFRGIGTRAYKEGENRSPFGLPAHGSVGVGGRIGALAGLAGKGAAMAATGFQTANALQGGNVGAPLQAGQVYQGLDPTGNMAATSIQGHTQTNPVAVTQIPTPTPVAAPSPAMAALQATNPNGLPLPQTAASPVASPQPTTPAAPVASPQPIQPTDPKQSQLNQFPAASSQPTGSLYSQQGAMAEVVQPQSAPVAVGTQPTQGPPTGQQVSSAGITQYPEGTFPPIPQEQQAHNAGNIHGYSTEKEQYENTWGQAPEGMFLADGSKNQNYQGIYAAFIDTVINRVGPDMVYKMTPHQLGTLSAYMYLKLR